MSGELLTIGWPSLAGAASLILVNGALSVWLRLGLERKLLVASLRTVVQLILLGYVLVPIFRWQSPWLVAGLGVGMIALASREAIRRTSRRYRGMGLCSFAAVLLGASTTTLLAVVVLVDVEPWWSPRYAIPLLGMVLGNVLTGISLGLDRCLTDLHDARDEVEALLAYGATRWEATRPTVQRALRTGMIPILNSMSVVGLVTIPGMMTGQLLGGTTPEVAARYQILVMFLIAAATALGVTAVVLMSVLALFDGDHRLRHERLQ